MSPSITELMESWDGLGVFSHYDRPTGAWIFIALHDDTLGMPLGGTRMRAYPSVEEGLRDALRLAESMTQKWAVIDVPFGGGKAVIHLTRPLEMEERTELLLRYGEILNSLDGLFGTGEDLGTTTQDMALLSAHTNWVFGLDPDTREVRDPGPYTALGVLAGMRAAIDHLYGDEGFAGRSVLVQGVGDVGDPLARFLADEATEVIVCDTDEARAEAVASAVGGRTVPPKAALTTECDVYAPCAIAGTLNRQSIPDLECRIVAGAANAHLEEPEDANRLHERGILYAPDYVVNAGGATAFGALVEGIGDDGEIRERVGGLYVVSREIFREAQEADESPVYAARRRVEAVLRRGPRETPVGDPLTV